MLRGFLDALFTRRSNTAVQAEFGKVVSLRLVSDAIYVVGDVHGCLRELQELLERIDRDAEAHALPYRVLLLGDLIDRGSNSAGVMDFLCSKAASKVFSILGNHEEMFLRFYDDPLGNSDWLDFGGFETLMSYGLALDRAVFTKWPHRRAKQVIDAHIPLEHINYLRSLHHVAELAVADDVFVVSHAGYNTDSSIREQSGRTLLWGSKVGHNHESVRTIHGHVVVDRADVTQSAIFIDTGCYKTGRLTALRIVSGLPLTILSNKEP